PRPTGCRPRHSNTPSCTKRSCAASPAWVRARSFSNRRLPASGSAAGPSRSEAKQAPMTATKLIPSLGVSDLERSLDFYRTFFGFDVVDSYDDDGRMAWCWLRSGPADLMLQQLSADQQIRLNPAIGQSWVVYVCVDDLDATHARLKQGGFPVSEIDET